MNLLDRTCICGHVTEGEEQIKDYEYAKKHNLNTYMNTSNGLTFLYICPECDAKVKEGLDKLKSVFGDLTKYIHFSNKL